jgi:hypothetical protein
MAAAGAKWSIARPMFHNIQSAKFCIQARSASGDRGIPSADGFSGMTARLARG